MSLGELTQTHGYKVFMGYVYGWGATVVMVGALFKIQHYPGASVMLIVGLMTEAVIFFLSAFEPPHEQVDWSLVYPELAGIDKDMDSINVEDKKAAVKSKKSALEKFDAMIENAEITPELFEKLGHGLKNLNTTTEKLKDVSDATAATNNYVANFEKASEKVNSFAEAYGASAEKLNVQAEKLASAYEKSAMSVGNSGEELSATYTKLIASMNKELETSAGSGKSYNEQLNIMNKNLMALNSVYEMQLEGTNKQFEAAKKLSTGLDEIMANMKQSAEDTKRYRDEIGRLSSNLAAMNTIYGNMLAAMNFKQN
ncbi:MAG: gliding motility protein GldL [Bacteroidales bacterium]|nr:gliding motility protein GldL [Bacteroidales bacterium]MBQ1730972.1 gliding motility protein GldL [Bacteroidales bacterium]MBQ5572189.1 gliding motility protein GldL [Bacteroidales bacterium]MBQ6275754.1 gliding motility protein GldL [Bacteroidales bacterium]MBR6067537.1 gliding motility protein GldL [Bacteroidales bacterium]